MKFSGIDQVKPMEASNARIVLYGECKSGVYLIFFLFLSSMSFGQCCSGGVPLSSAVGLPPAAVGTLQLNINYNWNHLSRLKSGAVLLYDKLRQRNTHAQIVASGYRFSPAISVDFFGAFVRQERTINASNGIKNFVFTQGIGDIVLLPKYHLSESFILGLGIKLPTGSSNFSDLNGIALPADLQPGSGAVDWIPYAYYHTTFNPRPSLQLASKLTYRFTGKNRQYFNTDNSYQFGNELQWQITLSDQLVVQHTLVDPSVGFRLRWAGRDFFNTQAFPSSGGNFVFVSIGFSVQLLPGFKWQWNATFPLYSFVNETQLISNFSLTTGIQWRLRKKQNIIPITQPSN